MISISVLMVIHNALDIIKESIPKSLALKEYFDNFEFLVCDNDCDEYTKKKLDTFEKENKISIHYLPEDVITYSALDHGLGLDLLVSKATFEYLLILDSDTLVMNPELLRDTIYDATRLPNFSTLGTVYYKYFLHPSFLFLKKSTIINISFTPSKKFGLFFDAGEYLTYNLVINSNFNLYQISNSSGSIWGILNSKKWHRWILKIKNEGSLIGSHTLHLWFSSRDLSSLKANERLENNSYHNKIIQQKIFIEVADEKTINSINKFNKLVYVIQLLFRMVINIIIIFPIYLFEKNRKKNITYSHN